MKYEISTCEIDIEDGYPDYCDEADSKEELEQTALKAIAYGLPPHRLTVTERWEEDGEEYHEQIGTLEEVLSNM